MRFLTLMVVALWAFAAFAQDEQQSQRAPFNPGDIKRDPFAPPAPPEQSEDDDLTHYDLNEIKLVAIMVGLGSPKAMVVTPNNKTHVVQIGDRLGRYKGKISQIRTQEVVVAESFRDHQNQERKSYTSLKIEK
jgi:Tfp pilus assembly protein PilP